MMSTPPSEPGRVVEGAWVDPWPWWTGRDWIAYEEACGDEPGTRQRLLDAATFTTRVVDLGQPQTDLWRGVRRSYHALINRTNNEHALRGRIIGAPTLITTIGRWSWVESCRRLHREVVGRDTRPVASWEIMEGWVQEQRAALAMVATPDHAFRFDTTVPLHGVTTERQHEIDAYALFIIHNRWAYYASAAARVRDVNHALVWNAIVALKRIGVRWLELGWQGEATDDKGRAIEFFRRGFGGVDVSPRVSGCGECVRWYVEGGQIGDGSVCDWCRRTR